MLQHLHIPQKLDGNVWRYDNLASANRRHTHAELELNLVTRGSGTYLLGQRKYRIRRGDLLWLFPSQSHVLMEQTSDFQMWIAVFRRRAIRRVAVDPGTRALLERRLDREACRQLAARDAERLSGLLEELGCSAEQPGFLNAGLGYALLEAWRCFGLAREVPVDAVHPAVERAATLIRDSPIAMPLPEVAHRAGLSTARLSRLFKQQTGFTLVEFRNRKRIERFLELYGTGQRQTMLNAALDSGFGSYPQFHRMFSRVMGCSPADYRRSASPHRAR